MGLAFGAALGAQGGGRFPAPRPVRKPPPAPTAPTATVPPAAGVETDRSAAGAQPLNDYIIGTDDVLSVVFWRDKDMSADVVVRPDGKITLPLLNDMTAAGLTPTQLREQVVAAAARFLEDPAATIVVKQINSRRMFITGEVEKPGPYNITTPVTVMQFIAMAGGLKEYAHGQEIVIMRSEGGKAFTFAFDYAAVVKKKKPEQNILLKPGDVVIVP